MRITSILLIVSALVVAAGFAYTQRPENDIELGRKDTPAQPSPSDNTIPWPPDPAQDKPPGVEPITKVVQVTLKTNKGDVVIVLDGTHAPLTVGNFVKLAKDNFYDGTTFHRVIPNFMIQGGDPKGNGTGGPGYQFKDEITIESLPLQRGVIAMANSGPNTNGSQFFIITAPSVPRLNGKHTPFGVVQQGLDVVMAIQEVPTDDNDKPIEPVIIEDVVVSDALGQGLETLE